MTFASELREFIDNWPKLLSFLLKGRPPLLMGELESLRACLGDFQRLSDIMF